MATYSSRTITEIVTRKEFFLEMPSNWAELNEMLCAVSDYAKTHGLGYDDYDQLIIESDSEEIRIVHEVRTDR